MEHASHASCGVIPPNGSQQIEGVYRSEQPGARCLREIRGVLLAQPNSVGKKALIPPNDLHARDLGSCPIVIVQGRVFILPAVAVEEKFGMLAKELSNDS